MVFVSDSSGRFGTSYVPQCIVNEHIKKSVGIKDNYTYRLFLQRNADKIMKFNTENAMTLSPKCNCPKCLIITKKTFFN